MYGFTKTKQQRGKAILTKTLNANGPIVEQLSRLRGGRGTFAAPNGTFLAPEGIKWKFGHVINQPIAARTLDAHLDWVLTSTIDNAFEIPLIREGPGSAEVLDGSLDPTFSFTAFNFFNYSINLNSRFLAAWISGCWMIVWSDTVNISNASAFYTLTPNSGTWNAVGAFPNATPGQFTAHVYQAAGATLVDLGNRTVYNWFPHSPPNNTVIAVIGDAVGNFVMNLPDY